MAGALFNPSSLPLRRPRARGTAGGLGHDRYARWLELVLGLVIMVALMAPIVGWYRTPASWVIVACTIGPGWLLGVYAFPPRSIGVGADWLRVRATRFDDWVQTNQLVRAGPGDPLDQPLSI